MYNRRPTRKNQGPRRGGRKGERDGQLDTARRLCDSNLMNHHHHPCRRVNYEILPNSVSLPYIHITNRQKLNQLEDKEEKDRWKIMYFRRENIFWIYHDVINKMRRDLRFGRTAECFPFLDRFVENIINRREIDIVLLKCEESIRTFRSPFDPFNHYWLKV